MLISFSDPKAHSHSHTQAHTQAPRHTQSHTQARTFQLSLQTSNCTIWGRCYKIVNAIFAGDKHSFDFGLRLQMQNKAIDVNQAHQQSTLAWKSKFTKFCAQQMTYQKKIKLSQIVKNCFKRINPKPILKTKFQSRIVLYAGIDSSYQSCDLLRLCDLSIPPQSKR